MVLVGLLYLTSFQFKERRRVLVCLLSGAFCVALHFFLLGKVTAGWLACVSGSRVATAYFTRSKKLMYVFFALAIVAFLATYNSPISMLLFISSMSSTWALFREEDRTMRLLYMMGTSLWLIHNIIIWTPGGIAIEAIFLCSNVVGFYRFYGRGNRVIAELT